MKIKSDLNCKNSPKRGTLRDFNIAFAEGNLDKLKIMVSNDVVWHMVGDKTVTGKEAFMQVCDEMDKYEAEALHFYSIITHGNEGAVNGMLEMKDGEKVHFCDVYTFKSAGDPLISKIYSYAVID